MKNKSINFGAKAAVAVFPTSQDSATTVLHALALPPYQAVLVIIGAANNLDPHVVPALTQLFELGIARGAVAARAVVVDGGTQAGVMALMGETLSRQEALNSHIGVVPASLVSYPGNLSADADAPLEPNHSHFVLVKGANWGSETAMLFQLAQALALQASTSVEVAGGRVVVVLAGGGGVALSEVVHAIRQHLPLVIVEGSGGTADAIAAAWKTRDEPPTDPTMAEITTNGIIHFFPLGGPAEELAHLLARELRTSPEQEAFGS